MAFQKPTTIQGKINVKSTNRVMRKISGVSGARVSCTKYNIKRAVVRHSTEKITRRRVMAESETIFVGGFKLFTIANL